MAQTTRIEGAREFERVLKQLPKGLRGKVLDNAVRAGANVVRKEAKRLAPRGANEPHPKFGRLVDNIRVSKDKRGRDSVNMILHTGRAFWGMFHEFGTSRMAARPFMRTAFDEHVVEALAKIGDRMGKNIEKTAKELAGKFRSIKRATRRRL